MPAYRVDVTIENKPGIADPEGATILNDLILAGGGAEGRPAVSEVRTAKMLRFFVDVGDGEGGTGGGLEDAKEAVQKMCDDLRMYNPLVSRASFEVRRDPRSPPPPASN